MPARSGINCRSYVLYHTRMIHKVPHTIRPLSRPRLSPALLSRKMSGKSYRDAIDALNSLQTNAATLAAIRASGSHLYDDPIGEFNQFVARSGLTVCFTSNRFLLSLIPPIAAQRLERPQCHPHHWYQRQRFGQRFHRLHPPTRETRYESRYAVHIYILPLF